MNRLNVGLASLATVFALTASYAAEEKPVNQQPEERQWLQRFSGEWELVLDSAGAGRKDAPTISKGLIQSRMLGASWVVSEWTNQVDGETVTAIQTIGFDSSQNKYISTWIDNVSSQMWRSGGVLEGNTLVLETEGPSPFEAGKQTKYRDFYEFKRDDYFIQSSKALNEEGEWVQLGIHEYRRQK